MDLKLERTTKVYLFYLCAILLVIGGLNWGLVGAFNVNLVKKINELTFNSILFENLIYIIVGIAAIYIGTNRNFYLPFLGDTVIATSLLKNQEALPNSNVTIQVDGEGAENVIFWAAMPMTDLVENEHLNKWDVAYGSFQNAGLARVINGKATLQFACPQKYCVNKFGMKKVIDKHVHYRLVYADGWISEVKTVMVNC